MTASCVMNEVTKKERILIFLSGIPDGKYKIYFASPKIKKNTPTIEGLCDPFFNEKPCL